MQSYQGETLYFNLSEELSGQVRELSRREGVTVFMTLLAAFQGVVAPRRRATWWSGRR